MDPVIGTHTKEHMSAMKEREQKDTMGKETDCNTCTLTNRNFLLFVCS